MAKPKDEKTIELENGSEIILTGKDTEVTTTAENAKFTITKIHNLEDIKTEELLKELKTRVKSSYPTLLEVLESAPPEELLKYISEKEGFFGDIDIIQLKLKKIDDSLSNLGYGENAKAELMKMLVNKYLI